ncbi:MAG: hypothetical protein KGS00_13335 [Alphaproteobacteria bacterium]|nr:hypothetical protein [Alphaproteobacteria bacterium]
MDIAHRIAHLGAFLRQTAGETTTDLNEQGLLAHCALVHILKTDPSLSGWPVPRSRGSWSALGSERKPREGARRARPREEDADFPRFERMDDRRIALRSGEAPAL